MGFADVIKAIDDFIWGWPLIIFILVAGLFLSVRLVFVQIRKLPKAFKYMVKKEKEGNGQISAFSALCTALSATIGTGNIVGVATAIVAGGPGALFWMIVAAFLGMATKFAECMLAVKYRTIDNDGQILGGPFLYIEKGMGKRWKWLAVLFAIFGICVGLFGVGTFTQINSITSAINNVFSGFGAVPTFDILGMNISLVVIISGIILTVLVAVVIIGGVKRISKVATLVVPFMAITYVLLCLIVIFTNITAIPQALADIVVSAFNPQAIAGGIMGSMIVAMQKGIARGIFSNEAGLGSAPIAAAQAQTKEPVRQGLVSMLGTFIDTIIICLMTGLTIVITGAWNIGLDGVDVTIFAFSNGLPGFLSSAAPILVCICLIFFAYTTIIGWSFYSESCLKYLVGNRKNVILAFRWVYIVAIFIGPYMTLDIVWTLADIFNALMALPNLIGIIALSGQVVRDTKDYFNRLKNPPPEVLSQT
ncbi:MAG: alanine:cation symporter family protein [Clostridia bacterium]|nr:alanine:cation symporter family protein [Clostridia bacterium]